MIQDPARLSGLLNDLCRKIGAARAYIMVGNSFPPRALVFSIAPDDAVTFHAAGDSFTRTIVEAHDDARRLLGRRESAGGTHGAAVEAKQPEDSTTTPDPAAGAAFPASPAASIFAQIDEINRYFGPAVPPEIAAATAIISAIAAAGALPAPQHKSAWELARASEVWGGLMDAEAKLKSAADYLSAGNTEMAGAAIEGARIQMSRIWNTAF